MKTLTLFTTLSAATAYQFNPLHHLAGIAPYFTPHDPPINPSPPAGCNVTRAAYLVRHAAIYANDFDYETYIEPFVDKLRNTTQNWAGTGSLSFLTNWTAPITDDHLEKLTRVGLQEATTLGAQFRQRYPDLHTDKVWASTAERTTKSAQGFITGYTHNQTHLDLVSVAESDTTGADSLTPYKSCPAYSSSYGSSYEETFINHYTAAITARLNLLAPTFNFTSDDITAMFELCGYETVIRGSSPFCSSTLFSSSEWLSFEYANDIMYFHNTGYGRPLSPVLGFPWVNASYSLLSANTTDQDIYVSFTHREVPPTVATALGLFNNSAYSGADNINETMPTDEVNYNRAWKSSNILPFLGNIGIERMECDGRSGYTEGVYYRVLVNEAVKPVPGCRDGPGESCSGDQFGQFVQEREQRYGDFGAMCGNSSAVGELSIYD
ncbi:putative histidine acid phosphatase [Aspergillus ibericus CBS 121593]|uniref:Phosphoglycerate mutase-like protein n=1 Tax=Aspergillus ibericus CBS 121593 TaxID=1448316 RepID=A0A395GXQ9_9EURO|nr:phosphoglycerate mutase-like protein [Aspergillus ibericus CBS 121593]RAL00140.1 phosphoglycerate mutase-like protein [Aspergillus ibericus CBS 121593]